MRLLWHMVAKDLRRMAWPTGAWLIFIAATTWGFQAITLARRGNIEVEAATWASTRSIWSIVIVATQFVIAFVLVGVVVVEDPFTGTTAFWQTRPIRNTRLFAAKLLVAGLLFVVGPAVALTPVWLACGFSAGEVGHAAYNVMFWQVWLTVPAFAIALLTGTLRSFLLASLGLAVAHSLCGAYWPTKHWSEPMTLAIRHSRNVLIQYAIVPVTFAIALVQGLTRRVQIGWLLVGLWLVATLAVRVAWPWDITSEPHKAWPTAQIADERQVTASLTGAIVDGNQTAPLTVTVSGAPSGKLIAPITGYANLSNQRSDPHWINLERAGNLWAAEVASALVARGVLPPEPHWRMNISGMRAPRDFGAADSSGEVLLAEFRPRIVGEVPLELGASLREGSTRVRLAAVNIEEDSVAFLLEEHRASARSTLPQENGDHSGGLPDCYLVWNRTTGWIEPLTLRETGAMTMNGVQAILREGSFKLPAREIGNASSPVPVPDKSMALVIVRFEVDHHLTRPLVTSGVTNAPTPNTP
jgi:hypothetical protein